MRLAVDATVGVTDIVEKMHHTIAQVHPPVGQSKASSTGGITGLVYRGVRGTTRLVGKGLDAGMTPLTNLLPEGDSPAKRDAFVSVINGAYGDHLLQTANPLAIDMEILFQGKPIASYKPGSAQVPPETDSNNKVILFVHGLCLNENHWTRDGENRGETLARKLGYTPLYLRYNSGLHIWENGKNLAGILETLQQNWPCPVDELALVGHSMGGLLARSACFHGELEDHQWLQQLRKLVTIGTPHQGAPLERGGNWVDYAMGISPYAEPLTRIAKKRSSGITDLRHGSITERQGFVAPLPVHVDCFAVAATLGKKRGRIRESLIGDGLVPVESALGQSSKPGQNLTFPKDHQWLALETGHLQLLGSDKVYDQIETWLTG